MKHIHHSPHISPAQPKHSLYPIFGHPQPLSLANHLYSGFGGLKRDLSELKSGASGLKGRDDLRDIVGDETEPGVVVIFLNNYIS